MWLSGEARAKDCQKARTYIRLLAGKGDLLKQALASLDVIDAKASGLGAIAGLAFAGNVFLLEVASQDFSLIAFAFGVVTLLLMVLAVGFSASCLWIISPHSSELQALGKDKTEDRLIRVYASRVKRYRWAYRLTIAAVASMFASVTWLLVLRFQSGMSP